jgi:hypothetical protein
MSHSLTKLVNLKILHIDAVIGYFGHIIPVPTMPQLQECSLRLLEQARGFGMSKEQWVQTRPPEPCMLDLTDLLKSPNLTTLILKDVWPSAESEGRLQAHTSPLKHLSLIRCAAPVDDDMDLVLKAPTTLESFILTGGDLDGDDVHILDVEDDIEEILPLLAEHQAELQRLEINLPYIENDSMTTEHSLQRTLNFTHFTKLRTLRLSTCYCQHSNRYFFPFNPFASLRQELEDLMLESMCDIAEDLKEYAHYLNGFHHIARVSPLPPSLKSMHFIQRYNGYRPYHHGHRDGRRRIIFNGLQILLKVYPSSVEKLRLADITPDGRFDTEASRRASRRNANPSRIVVSETWRVGEIAISRRKFREKKVHWDDNADCHGWGDARNARAGPAKVDHLVRRRALFDMEQAAWIEFNGKEVDDLAKPATHFGKGTRRNSI